MNDPTIPAAQAMILIALCVAFLGLLEGCASPYQPPGGGIWVGVKHVEQQRKP